MDEIGLDEPKQSIEQNETKKKKKVPQISCYLCSSTLSSCWRRGNFYFYFYYIILNSEKNNKYNKNTMKKK